MRSENTKDTLCRNVTIYGKCRYEDKGMIQFIPYKIRSGADGGQAVLLATQYLVPIQISAKSMRTSFVLILEGS